MKTNKLFTMLAIASFMLGTLAFNACSTSETGTTTDTNMETETGGETGGESAPDTTGTEMNDDTRPNSPDDDMGTGGETEGMDSMNEVK